jgi:hypothetical protein
VTGVELVDTCTMRERLVAAYRLATPLVKAFGVSELRWLKESGELRVHDMRRNLSQSYVSPVASSCLSGSRNTTHPA